MMANGKRDSAVIAVNCSTTEGVGSPVFGGGGSVRGSCAPNICTPAPHTKQKRNRTSSVLFETSRASNVLIKVPSLALAQGTSLKDPADLGKILISCIFQR